MNKFICFSLISLIIHSSVNGLNHLPKYSENSPKFDIEVDIPLYSVDCKKHDLSLCDDYYSSTQRMDILYQLDNRGTLNRFDKYEKASQLYPECAQIIKKHSEGFYRTKLDELEISLDSDDDSESIYESIYECSYYDGEDEYYDPPLDRIMNITVNGGKKISDVKKPIIRHTHNHNAPQGLERLTIPNDVTKIGNYAFADMILNFVTIPNTVKSIGKYAFHQAVGIYEINIPKSVVEIKEGAFQGCDLRTLTLYEDVVTIGDNAFYNCDHLDYVLVYHTSMTREHDRITTLLRDAGVQCQIDFRPKANIDL